VNSKYAFFICIYIKLYECKEFARRCERCVRAVRAEVCGGAHASVRTVMHAAVCGSVLGSVWQCARQCAAVRQCGSVRQCARLCVAVRAAVCGSVWQCVAVCNRALYILLYTKSPTIYIGMPL
jgi:hypothetical protein